LIFALPDLAVKYKVAFFQPLALIGKEKQTRAVASLTQPGGKISFRWGQIFIIFFKV